MGHMDSMPMAAPSADPLVSGETVGVPDPMALTYVVVAGNSGAGKSTLLTSIANAVRARAGGSEGSKDDRTSGKAGAGIDGKGRVIVCDEKRLKHRLLIRQFEDPEHWALPMQLAYIVERYTYIRTVLEEAPPGSLLLMERCLWEDRLFLEHYVRRELIPEPVQRAYETISSALREKTPIPRIVIHLRAPARWLHARLERAYANGDRQVELLDEPLMRYLRGVNQLYDEWCEEARGLTPSYIEHDVSVPGFSIEPIVEQVCSILLADQGRIP